jgi:DNA-binding CsgD family transcriptional regulator
MLSTIAGEARARDLRRRLLDERRDAPASMLDCAAHMLLYADDPATAQRIGLRHLLERFDATRIDLGFASPGGDAYVASSFVRREDCDAPSPVGVTLPNRDRGIQVVWRSDRPVYLDIARDPLLARMRHVIRDRFHTKAKLARRLEYEGELFGIVCVDQTVERRVWSEADHAYLDRFVQEFLSPVLYESRELATPLPTGLLTEIEKAVVRLAVEGLTYKEIARRLGKSPNTVDNQLRRIRAKLGVHNQVELVRASVGHA